MSVLTSLFKSSSLPVEATEVDLVVVKPKVLIGVAGFLGVIPECQENFFGFAYRCGRDNKEYDFLLKIIIKREQFRARNSLVDLAIANGCEWLLMLDDDMVIPPNLFKLLKRHDKDVMGALYYQRGGACHPVIMHQTNEKDGLKGIQFISHNDPMLANRGLYKIDGVIGGGCMLFKVDAFRKIPQPYFWIDGIVGTDVHVCNQFTQAGVELWVDTSIELGHVGEKQVITSRTLPHYSMVLGEINDQLWGDLKTHYMKDDLQLSSDMTRAADGEVRAAEWEKEPRDTWEQVRKYYQKSGPWHVLNLASFNVRFDQAREFVINGLQKFLKPGSHVVDYGCGIGYVSIPMAERLGYFVTALELQPSATMDFMRWRVTRHRLSDKITTIGFDEPIPPDLEHPADAVLMISVFDHLWDPMGALDWATRNTKPEAWLVVDSWRSTPMEKEPQHILKFDAHQVMREFKKRGWQEVPENPFLFKKGG